MNRIKRKHDAHRTIIAACWLAASSGCYVEAVERSHHNHTSDSGHLWLSLLFDGLSCADAGVERVKITVRDRGEVAHVEDRCRDIEDGTGFGPLDAGTYLISLEARAADGLLLYATYDESVRVYSKSDNEYSLDVAYASADVTLYWSVNGYSPCDYIDRVWLRLYDPFGRLTDDSVHSCAPPGLIYEDLQSGLWELDAVALDANDYVLQTLTGGVIVADPEDLNEYDLAFEL